jgi:hypothetical protein
MNSATGSVFREAGARSREVAEVGKVAESDKWNMFPKELEHCAKC